MSLREIPNSDLHAYVDGELSEERHAEIEAWLGEHSEDLSRVDSYRNQKASLRLQFDAVLDEPLPDHLRALATPAQSSSDWQLPSWSLQRIAAGFVIAFLGGSIGWLAHDHYRAPETLGHLSPLPHRAAIAHAVFSPDVRRPVEIGVEHEDQLIAWLSKRLGTPVRPPKLGVIGFDLIGGRLLPGNSGPVAQFMYQDATGQRLTLYVSAENKSNQETAFRFAQEGAVNVFYWIDRGFGYAISGSVAKDDLARVSRVVYEQFQIE